MFKLKYFFEVEVLVKVCIDVDLFKRSSATEILAYSMWWDVEKKF